MQLSLTAHNEGLHGPVAPQTKKKAARSNRFQLRSKTNVIAVIVGLKANFQGLRPTRLLRSPFQVASYLVHFLEIAQTADNATENVPVQAPQYENCVQVAAGREAGTPVP